MLAVHIAEQREIQLPNLMEFKNGPGIFIGHAPNGDAEVFKLVLNVTRFHELSFAKHSPDNLLVGDRQQSIGPS